MDRPQITFIKEGGLPRLKWEYEKERTGWEDLLAFGTADMDVACPAPILDALKKVLENGHLGYAMTPDCYFDAIHNWLMHHCGWDVDTRCAVALNVGVYLSAQSILDILTRPGDRVALLTPVHFCFKRKLNLNGRVPIECPLVEIDGRYTIDCAALEACFQSGCRLLWMCNPHNPVGRAWSRQELQKIADLCLRYDVYIMSDDVYCGLLFPGQRYTPIASLSKEISYRTVTMYSTSKSYNTTGLRHSFILTENPELLKRYREDLDRLDLSYGQSSLGIAAAIAAFEECDPWLEALMEKIAEHHQLVTEFCRENLPGAKVAKADSTYFAWIDLRGLGIPPAKLGYLLEQETHMVVESGIALGKGGAGFIRLNLAIDTALLQEGLKRLQTFWQRYKR